MDSSPHFPRNSTRPRFPITDGCYQMINIPALTFDRVHHGHISASALPLFRMPVELLAHVTRCLSRRDLQALALVDRDCCKIAALSQFKDLALDLDSKPFSKSNLSRNGSPSNLTDCVRQLLVSTYSTNGSNAGSTPPKSDFRGDIPLPAGYAASFDQVITKGFPNLHIFNWDGPAFSSSDIIRCITSSSLKHVRLRGTVLDPGGWDSTHQTTHSSSLETLCLDISWDANRRQPKNVTFFNGLLHIVHKNLQQLSWIGCLTDDNIIMADFDTHSFPNLRSLVLDSIASDSNKVIYFFLGEKTRIQSLSMDTATPSTRTFFDTRGYIFSLKHLSLIGQQWSISSYVGFLNFLNVNTQLETVHLAIPILAQVIDECLIPVFRRDFDMLTHLQLTFDAPNIHPQSLQALSSLTTLQRFWLSAGSQDYRSTWKICHEDVIKYLTPLVNLELLAFSHDTYTTNLHVLAPRYGDYYMSKALPVDFDIEKYLTPDEYLVYEGGEIADFEVAILQQHQLRQQAWERWHVESMLSIANRYYSQTFLALRWCFIGQLAFAGEGPASFITADSRPQRDPSLTSLRRKMSIDVWRPV